MTSTYNKSAKYIDLKIHGRLFPTWVLANFKDYKLPEMLKKTLTDPCALETKEGKQAVKKELRKYQTFISNFLDYRSPYRDVLLYHGLGSGKTGTAINVYNALYNYTPGWNVFLLIKASLKQGWIDELNTWLSKDQFDYRYRNIIFLHYDSPIADKKFLEAVKNVDSSKKSLYIIDEVHNFIRNVYSNVSSGSGKRAQVVYDYIIQDKRENPDTRVVLLSGTPAVNTAFELALLFNLLRPGIFPRSENDFSQQFISGGAYRTLSKSSKNLFQRRIMGLVSYYIGSTPDVFATKTIHYVDVKMSDYQKEIYNYYEEIEAKILQSSRNSKTYSSYTRQACNFVFPAISQSVTGESRPRPNKFRISEREALKLSEGRAVKDEKSKDKLLHVSEYLKAIEHFIKSFDNHLESKDEQDKNENHTIINDVETFIKKYGSDFKKFNTEEKKKSHLFNAMHVSSAKMLNIIFNIMMSKGPTIVYSNYVLMEGIEIFKIYLKYFGFYSFNDDYKLKEGRVGYVEFHGGIKDINDRYKGRDVFNKSENKNGSFIKIMLISPAGSEGLSLMNVRQVHIMEPYWNEVRILQMIGRGIRQCSHALLPLEERHVDVYRYKSIRESNEKWTTDQHIEDLARGKEGLIQSFLDAMKEVAIDCKLFQNHNMINQDYKCFQFEEPSLFDKNIGPSYKEDMYDDIKLDNGSNSINAMTIKIKVMLIKAVKLLSSPNEATKEYSQSDFYWYNSKTQIVYDRELHYTIGRVAMDMDNLPVKLDKDTFVIDYVIPIPLIE